MLVGASITSENPAKRAMSVYRRDELPLLIMERFKRRMMRLRQHHKRCEERQMKFSRQDGEKRDDDQVGEKRDEDQDGEKRDEDQDGEKRDEDQDGEKRDDDQDGEKRDEDQDGEKRDEDQDGEKRDEERYIEEQSNQGDMDSSDEGIVFIPSAEQSTNDDDYDSEKPKTIRKTIKDTMFQSANEVKIRGKRGKKVPVHGSMEMLNGSRSKVGIDKDNPYVFARKKVQIVIKGTLWRRLPSVQRRPKMTQGLLPDASKSMNAKPQKKMPQRMKMNNSLPQNNSTSRKSVRHKRHISETDASENEDDQLSTSKLLSRSRKSVRRKCHISETDALENEDEQLSTSKLLSRSRKSVRRKCNISETDALENEDDQLSTSKLLSRSRKSVRRKRHISETGKKAPRRPWSSEEQDAVKRTLGKFFSLRKVPGKVACQSCLDANPVLKSRSWVDIKNLFHNTLQTMKRKLAFCRNAV